MVESLVLKFLLARGDATGREIADQIKLPFILVNELLRAMKNDQLVGHKRRGADERFSLSARPTWAASGPGGIAAHCTYFGAAPVSLDDYVASVQAQSLTGQQPKAEHLRRGIRRSAAEPADARPARPGDQLRPRAVPLRIAGQRQDQHRRAGHRAPSARTSGFPAPSASTARSSGSSTRPTTRKCPWKPCQGVYDRRQDRQALGPHPPAHAGRRRRVDHVVAGGDAQHLDRRLRSPAATEEQLRHAGDRRLRPPAASRSTSC